VSASTIKNRVAAFAIRLFISPVFTCIKPKHFFVKNISNHCPHPAPNRIKGKLTWAITALSGFLSLHL
jgi:hypothetical protein